MSLSPTIKQTCEQRLDQLFEHAAKLITSKHQVRDQVVKKEHIFFQVLGAKQWRKAVLKKPTLLFTQRGKIAGSALLQNNIIKLHPILLAENLDYYLDEVIAHELSHILVYQLFGLHQGLLKRTKIKPHGAEWQSVMTQIFNLPARVSHQLDISSVSPQGFNYRCDCQVIELSLIRHNKVRRGKQQYFCRRCKQALKEVSQAIS